MRGCVSAIQKQTCRTSASSVFRVSVGSGCPMATPSETPAPLEGEGNDLSNLFGEGLRLRSIATTAAGCGAGAALSIQKTCRVGRRKAAAVSQLPTESNGTATSLAFAKRCDGTLSCGPAVLATKNWLDCLTD